MKDLFTLLILSLLSLSMLQAQSTAARVYQIFQEKCSTCHNNQTQRGNLDLEGAGASVTQKMADVYNNVFRASPTNSTAANKGDALIYPGRPDRSFLYRKINNGLEPTISLDLPLEGQPMPADGHEPLPNEEIELIRQWILYGAPGGGTVVNEQLIDDYYNFNGLASFPDGPPPAPAADEGFQIKMGPFYLEPDGELEYFQKYELKLPEDVEVTRLEILMSTSSHHFIIYNFEGNGANAIGDGLRLEANHSNIGLVAAVQETTDLRLPGGTAFSWDNDLVLDLNSHYINYSAVNTYQAEAYVNVYTQEKGIAAQEMKTELLANFDIFIPNNGNPVSFDQNINYNLGEIYLWGLMGHTHKYGTGYRVFERVSPGVRGEMIYDASCPNGIPGCVSPYFDYQHIPFRYFEPLRPLTMNIFNGLVHEAFYLNDGPRSVNFGPTSDDEMMVLIIMYTDDTTGVVSDVPIIERPDQQLVAFPNPSQDVTTLLLPNAINEYELQLFDLQGRLLRQETGIQGKNWLLSRDNLPAGMYYLQLVDQYGKRHSGKIAFQ